MTDPYEDREQTKAKHFILQRYLQALAFKTLHFSDLTYVDGFSGPWKTKTENFADTSFMIAISALRDAQKKMSEQTGTRRKIRCFFSEKDAGAFAKLCQAVEPYNKPHEGFEIETYCGEFENAISDIKTFVGSSFALIFIDPTGWSGYAFEKIKSLFEPRKCEVLINFMYSFVSRFIDTGDNDITESLDPILGGPAWRERLDKGLPRGEAVLALFRETLRGAGSFKYVVATKIDKPTENRPHFFMAYGTKSYDGLQTFREVECKALKAHAMSRAGAKERKQESKSHTRNLFADHEARVQEALVDDDIRIGLEKAKPFLIEALARSGESEFSALAGMAMEKFMVRETNIKDLLVQLARENRVENTWGEGNRKPREGHLIKLI